jgi:BirA family biotin operon repressor/biotin-[acetyl-CoA-carboxylase] ligase
MTEQLIALLREHLGSFVSGEQLSRELGCSRTAVWKQIRHLKERGYEFESAPRKGYRLLKTPERLDANAIVSKRKAKLLGRSVKLYDEIDSTQNAALELVRTGAPEGTLVIAEQQTSGRGRMGRPWHSPHGKGIWMSLILKPEIPLAYTPQLTLLVAVALSRAIKYETGASAGIKWPNDLLIGGRKVSGILLETHAEGERLQHLVAGVGISVNLAQQDFPEELHSRATSLLIETGKVTDREALICAFLEQMEELYVLYHKEGFAPIRTLWEALSVTLNRPVRVNVGSNWTEGIAEGIDELGALVVRLENGERAKLFSGEVELR